MNEAEEKESRRGAKAMRTWAVKMVVKMVTMGGGTRQRIPAGGRGFDGGRRRQRNESLRSSWHTLHGLKSGKGRTAREKGTREHGCGLVRKAPLLPGTYCEGKAVSIRYGLTEKYVVRYWHRAPRAGQGQGRRSRRGRVLPFLASIGRLARALAASALRPKVRARANQDRARTRSRARSRRRAE